MPTHITGTRDGPPVKVGVAVTDILTGHHAQSGVLAALIKRGKTGRGSRVECSLFESQVRVPLASLFCSASNHPHRPHIPSQAPSARPV